MTLETIFDRLTAVDYQAQALIRDIGMDDGCELRDAVALDRSDPDEIFLFSELDELLVPFLMLHRKLAYLRLPCGDPHRLKRFPNGRYGYDVPAFEDGYTFSSGSPLEALVHDGDGCPCWVSTRIEHDGTDYYLYGHSGIPLDGLTIRERRNPA